MALIENRHGRSPRSPSIRWQLFLLGAGCSACCFVRPIALFPWQGTSQRRRRGALAAAATSVEEVFAVLKDELSNCTPLANELSVVLGCGREFLESLPVEDQERGLELFREMTEWQKMQRGSRQSLGPLAVSALLHPESGREIILVGTPHSLPGAVAVTNPVPKAVQRTVKALKPELVAVELDEARGVRELEKRPKLRGQSPILLPDSEGSPLQGLFQIFSQPELGLDEELLQRIRAKAGSRLSVKGYLRALRQIYAKSSEKCLAMNVFALDELRAEGDGDWGQDATAPVLAAQRAELPILFCDLPQEWTLGKVIPIYNKEWVAARGKRLKFLEDLDVATRFLQAEEAMIREAVMSGHGGDLPSLDYGLGLCRPAVGFAEAATRRLWLEERDPAMANAVTSALEGRARVLEGKHSRLEAKQRAVLQVGCCHVEGIVKSLQQHGYKVVPEPQGGWPDLTSKGKVPVRTKKTSRQSKNVRSKPRAAGFA